MKSLSHGPEPCASANSATSANGGGGWIRTIEVGDNRFTVCPLWPLGNPSSIWSQHRKTNAVIYGAGDGTRTRDLLITNQLLYQLSYTSVWCLRAESNHRHGDFQSPALPTELQRLKWRSGRGSNPRPLA